MDDYSVTNYIYILLTSVRNESYRVMSGIFDSPMEAKRSADRFCGYGEDRTGEILRISVAEMSALNWYSVGMDSLPFGTDIVYLVTGTVVTAE